MDSVVFDGVTFIKASVLAKQFRYTPDYIGQLCRSKKVDARLVGRTWFVNPESVISHKKDKYSRVDIPAETNSIPHKPIFIKPGRISVEPVMNSKTSKFLAVSTEKKNLGSGTRKLEVSYEVDDQQLMPTMAKKASSPARFSAEEQEETNMFKVEINKLAEADITVPVDTLPVETEKWVDLPQTTASSRKVKVLEAVRYRKAQVSPEIDEAKSLEMSVEPIKPLKTDVYSKTDKVSNIAPNFAYEVHSVKIPFIISASPLIAIVVAILVVVTLFSLSTSVVVSATSYHSEIVIKVVNLLAVLQHSFW